MHLIIASGILRLNAAGCEFSTRCLFDPLLKR